MRQIFGSLEAYEMCRGKYTDADVITIDNGEWWMSDMYTFCKHPATVIRRFFNSVGHDPRLDGWEECLLESVENGYYEQNDCKMADGTRNPIPSWAFGIEELYAGKWYMFLNVRYKDDTVTDDDVPFEEV